jgi:hypothetical protein
MVAASFISDYHIHQQMKPDRGVSDFRIEVIKFANDIVISLGMTAKLIHINNGHWTTPLDGAKAAMEEARTIEFPFVVKYKQLASANNNDIELISDQRLPGLYWQPDPEARFLGGAFLYQICSEIFNLVRDSSSLTRSCTNY